MEDFIASIFLFSMGAAFASFLNVLVQSGKDSLVDALARDRSKCDSCGGVLRWWELVPIASWVVQRGRCTRCEARISWLHPVSEFVLGSVFVLGYLSVGFEWSLVLLLVIILLLYFFSAFDLIHGIVPNKYLFPVIFVVLFARIFWCVWGDIPLLCTLGYLGASVLYFSFFAAMNFLTSQGLIPGVPKKNHGFGWGDAKLALLLGLFLGLGMTAVAMWVAIFAGGIVGVILLMLRRKRLMKVPYAPFMSFGAVVALLYGEEIWEWFRNLLII